LLNDATVINKANANFDEAVDYFLFYGIVKESLKRGLDLARSP